MKKIAVMLPIAYRGGSLRGAKNIAKSIALASQKEKNNIQVVFSYVENSGYDLYQDFNDLKEYGISLRATTWHIFSRASLLATMPIIGMPAYKLTANEYCLPMDGANDFYDCDLWIIVSDRLSAPIFPMRKYISVIYDYIQRYVPEIWDDTSGWDNQEKILFPLVRNAELVFVTTPSTRADLIAYAGVPGNQIALIEMEFEPVDSNDESAEYLNAFNFKLSNDYFIWPTNSSFHKNHINAFKALQVYYQELGGNMDVVITGFSSEIFDPERDISQDLSIMKLEYIQTSRRIIQKSFGLKTHIHFSGEVPDHGYAHLIRGAKFLWHPALYDNGTFSVMEAAYFQKPSLSARYPAMEFIDEKFNLNLSFFNPQNVKEMAQAIFLMEKNYCNIQLPERSILMERSWQSFAPQLLQSICEIL